MGHIYRHLSLSERIEIYRLRCDGSSLREIGRFLGRSVSTISRELGRNCGDRRGRRGPYDPLKAARRCWMRRRMYRRFKLARQPALRSLVRDKLVMGWSPEQISGWLAREDGSMRISHESIYRYVYHRTRHHDHWHKLLANRRYRRGHKRRRKGPLGIIKHRHGLMERCCSADDRLVAGHWEADLMCFSKTGPVMLIANALVTSSITCWSTPRAKLAAALRMNTLALVFGS
jgi:IS30 family transposase